MNERFLLRKFLPLIFSFFAVSAFSQPCFLQLSISDIDSVECPGTNTGGVYLSFTGGQGAVQCVLDGTTPFPGTSILNSVGAGPHYVIATDGAGCMDTVTFVLPDPPPMSVTATSTPAKCNGDNSGSVTAVGMGIQTPLTYSWQKCTGGQVYNTPMVSNLYAGCYSVTLSDSKGCTAVTQVNISEPPPFMFMSTQDSADCYNTPTGIGTIIVSGGTGPYTYLWGNGQTTATATGLMAGFPAVTVTDAQNCSAVTLVPILQPANLAQSTVTSINTDITCFGQTNGTMTLTVINGGTKPYTFNWSAGTISPDMKMASNLGVGFCSVTITDWHGCSAVKDEFISQPQDIQLVPMVKHQTCFDACDGEITITPGFGTPPFFYAWSDPTISPVPDPKNLCPGTYTVTATDAAGCTKTLNVTVNAAPTIVIQLIPTPPKCANSTDGSIICQATGGSGSFTYKWSNNSTSATISGVGAGNWVVTVTDAKGCTNVNSLFLIAPNALVFDSISVVSAIKCNGDDDGSMKAFAHGGTAPLSFKWNDPNNQIVQTSVGLAAGTFTVTVTDGNGCTVTGQKNLSQPTQLNLATSQTSVKCFGESSGKALASPTGGTTPYTYTWLDGQTTMEAVNLPVGSITVTVTDKNGCTDTDGTTVTGPATGISLIAAQTKMGCFGKNDNEAQASANGGNGAPFTWLWSNGSMQALVTGLGAGNYFVTASDSKGCTEVKSVIIGELAQITLNVAATSASCFGSADGSAGVNIISGGAGGGTVNGYTYFWNTTPSQAGPLASGLAGGQTYTVVATDAQGCSGTASATIPSPAEITFDLNEKQVTCFGGNDGEVSVINYVGANPAVSYVWSPNAVGATTATATGLASGFYTVTVTDSKGCTKSGSTTLDESTQLVIDDFLIEQLACNGDSSGRIEAIASGGTVPYQFLWSTGETGSGIRDLKAGQYELTLTDANGCSTVESVIIQQPNHLELITEVKDVSCFGLHDGRLNLIPIDGQAPISFSIDGLNFTASSGFANLTAGWYLAFAKDANGCVEVDTFEIKEPAKIDLELGPDVTLQLGDSVLLIPALTNGTGTIELTWKPEYAGYSNCTDSTCQEYLVKPQHNFSVTLIGEDENGCRTEDFIKIFVEKNRGIFVPTGFSPNGDGKNDRLTVFGKSRIVKEITVFRIFDRWGELVFENENFVVNDESIGWDGLFRGEEMQPGPYVWFVEAVYIDGFVETQKGSTTLIR